MKMRFLLAFAVLLLASPASAAPIASTQAGDWHTGSTWTGGSVPGASDDAIVNHNITVGADITTGGYIIIAANKTLTLTASIDVDATAVQVGGTLAIGGYQWKFTTPPTSETTITTRAYTLCQVTNGGTLDIDAGGTFMADDDASLELGTQVDYLLEPLAGSTVSLQGEWVGYATINTLQPSDAPKTRISLRNYKQTDVDGATHVRLETGPFKGWMSAFTDEGNGVLLLDKGKIGYRIMTAAAADSFTFTEAVGDSMELFSGAMPLWGGTETWEPEDTDNDGVVTRDDVVAAQFDRGASTVIYMNNDIYHTSTDSIMFTEGLYPSAVISLWKPATIAGGETAPSNTTGVGMSIWMSATNMDFDWFVIKNINGDKGSGPTDAQLINWTVNGGTFTLDYGYYHDSRGVALMEITDGGVAGADSVFIRDVYFETNYEEFESDHSDGHGIEFQDDTEQADAIIIERCGFRRLSDDAFYFAEGGYARFADCWVAQPLGNVSMIDTFNSVNAAQPEVWIIRPHAYGIGDSWQTGGAGSGAAAGLSTRVIKIIDPYITRPFLRFNRDADNVALSGHIKFENVGPGSTIDGGIIQWASCGGLGVTQSTTSDADSVTIRGVTFQNNCFYPTGSQDDQSAKGWIIAPFYNSTSGGTGHYILDSCVFKDNWRFADQEVVTTSGATNVGMAVLNRGVNNTMSLRGCTITSEKTATTAGTRHLINSQTAGNAINIYGCWLDGGPNRISGLQARGATTIYRSVFHDVGFGAWFQTAGVLAAYNYFLIQNNQRSLYIEDPPVTLIGNVFVLTTGGSEPVWFEAAADTVGLISDWNVYKTPTGINPVKINATSIAEATWQAAGYDTSYSETSNGANSWTDIFAVSDMATPTWSENFRPRGPLRDQITGLADKLNDIGAFKYVK